MLRLTPYVFVVIGLFFLLRGLAAVILLLGVIILTPFLVVTYQRAKRKEFDRVRAILGKTERTLNAGYARQR